MSKVAVNIAIIVGIILSGQCAVWGTCLGGRDLRAGSPFPDFMAIGLFLLGVTVIPLGVVVLTTVVRRFLSKRFTSVRISVPLAILILGPLFGLIMGYSVQARENRKKEQGREFEARQREAYSQLAAQLTADPGIALRERWFELNWEVGDGAVMSARQMVFRHSFDSAHLNVAYTGEQLREISERAQGERLSVIYHPMCPPDLLEVLWPLVWDSRDSCLIEAIINHPATPRHLFEEYQAEGLNSKRTNNYWWVDIAIEKRLKIIPNND